MAMERKRSRDHRHRERPATPVAAPTPSGMPPDVRLMLSQAEAARAAGRLAESETQCRKVLAAWPGHPDAIHTLGLVALGRGNLEMAHRLVSRACQAASAPANYFS